MSIILVERLQPIRMGYDSLATLVGGVVVRDSFACIELFDLGACGCKRYASHASTVRTEQLSRLHSMYSS